MEQGGRSIEEFVQEFKRVARESRYEGRLLVEEFKRGMSGAIKRKLIEAERPPTSIEQWYECATNLDQNWRESKREEERMREQQEQGQQAPRQNNEEVQWSQLPQHQVWPRRQEVS